MMNNNTFDYKAKIFIGLCVLFIPYSFFVYTLGTEEKYHPGINFNITKGKNLWQQYNCIACHQLYGLGGYMGPELTTVISQKGENYAKAFIRNGTLRMPDFHLSDDEVNALTEYLKYVDATAETYRIAEE